MSPKTTGRKNIGLFSALILCLGSALFFPVKGNHFVRASSQGATLTPTLTATSLPSTKLDTFGKGSISTVYPSPDKKIDAYLENGVLRWVDARTFQELGSVDLETGDYPGEIFISPDHRLAAVHVYLGAAVVDLANQKILGYVGNRGNTDGFAFPPDDHSVMFLERHIIANGEYAYINRFDTATGNVLYDPDTGAEEPYKTLPARYYSMMTAPAVSPNSKWVAAGDSENHVYLWDLQSGKTRYVLDGHADSVTSVDFSPDGASLASSSRDGTVRLWNVATGKLVRVISGFRDDVSNVKFLSGRRLLVSVFKGPDVVVDLQTGAVTPVPPSMPDPFTIFMHQQGYVSLDQDTTPIVVYSPDGARLAVGGMNVTVWDVSSQQLIAALEMTDRSRIAALVYSPDGSRLAAIDGQGQTWAWDIPSGQSIFQMNSETSGQGLTGFGEKPGEFFQIPDLTAEHGLAFSLDGNDLVFRNGDAIEVWDIRSGQKVMTLEKLQPPAYATRISFSRDGKRIYAILNYNLRAAIWDAVTGKLLHEIPLPEYTDSYTQTSVDLSGPFFARENGNDHEWIELVNLDTGKILHLEAQNSHISSTYEQFHFSPDDSLLTTGSNDHITFWDTNTGQVVGEISKTIQDSTWAISPDRQTLAALSGGLIDLWDIRSIGSAAGRAGSISPTPTATPTALVTTNTPSAPNPTQSGATPTPISLPPGAISPMNAARISEIKRVGRGTIDQVAWSTDGSQVTVVGSRGMYCYAVQKDTFSDIDRLEPGAEVFSGITLPDGRSLASGVDGTQVKVWDVSTGQALFTFTGQGQPSLSPDGSMLVYGDERGNLQLRDLKTGEPGNLLLNYSHYSTWPTFSPDGHWVAAVSGNNSVRVWDVETGVIVNALGGPDSDITDLSFSSDGGYIVGAAGGSAWVWSIGLGTAPYQLPFYEGKLGAYIYHYENTVTAVAISPDDRTVAVGTSENTLYLYDKVPRKERFALTGHTNAVHRLKFSPDGKTLLAADEDGNLILWDVNTGNKLSQLSVHAGRIGGLVFRADGNLSAWEGGTAWVIRPADGQILHTTQITAGTILAVSPDGRRLAVTAHYQVSILDATTGAVVQILDEVAPDIQIDHLEESRISRGFLGASFSPDSKQLTTRAYGGSWVYTLNHQGKFTVTQSDTDDGRYLIYQQQRRDVTSPDQRWIGRITNAPGGPNSFALVNPTTQEVVKSLQLSDNAWLTNLTFSPDGRLAAVSESDGSIVLIDVSTVQFVATLKGHQGEVDQIAFSPDGKYLVSGGVDGTIRFWGVQ